MMTFHVEQQLSDGSWVRLGEQTELVQDAIAEIQRLNRENQTQEFRLVKTTIITEVIE